MKNREIHGGRDHRHTDHVTYVSGHVYKQPPLGYIHSECWYLLDDHPEAICNKQKMEKTGLMIVFVK